MKLAVPEYKIRCQAVIAETKSWSGLAYRIANSSQAARLAIGKCSATWKELA